MRVRSLVLAVALLVGVVADGELLGLRSNSAHAQRLVIEQPQTQRSIELNIHGTAYYGFDWVGNGRYPLFYDNYALGLGVQMLFPVMKNGFIPSLNNAFYIGFFTDFLAHPSYLYGYGAGSTFYSLAFGPIAQWRFILLDMFQGGSLSVFTNLGFGLWPWFLGNTYAYGGGTTAFFGFPLFELGANMFFSKLFGLTLSFGYPSVKFGVSLAF